MWKVLPKLGLLKLLLAIFSALFLSALILLIGPDGGDLSWGNFGDSFKLATPITLIFVAIIFCIGKWGWLIFWKLPFLGSVLHKAVCPNLNGKWLGEVHSSYTDENGKKTVKEVELTIKADLFGFNLALRSLDGYQGSKVIQSELYRDPRTGTFYLSYIFEALVPIPKDTDDRFFEGAAKLEIIINEENTVLKGTYWTNRAWQRGMNTAGLITMERKNK
ncbi:Cap15 family cyclic dinucleotide receptor domain-containing protein [Halomonas sp. N3-2A]|uniref:Cap15 family cyclic dinucleotide receptor domain-containing protein n=1 Tax=Halomonas sp. N3-2A TaxID=2014541 RepID=UPI000B5B30B5|nr:hypothetical protein [Halomonas sp. N3-2A]ASK19251.1 hypothetical protein CEK60_08005 [Halomonas sp. N3-2A]